MKQNKFEGKTVVGLCGGIGTGKSTILESILHFPVTEVILADDVGRELMNIGGVLYDELLIHYGETILSENGEIDKKKLASIAFRTRESQKEINEIEHPIIRDEIIRRIRKSEKKVIFIEAALLFEGNLDSLCDEIWAVYVDTKERIRRLMSDRGYTREKCESVMRLQMSDEELSEKADLVIDNSGLPFLTREHIYDLMEERFHLTRP